MRRRLALVVAVCLRGVPAQVERPDLFVVDRTQDPPMLAADSNGVTCERALLALGQGLGWRVDFETKQLENALAMVAIDLAFERQPPRTVAHLIAAAGGADVVFDDRTEEGVLHTRVHVVSPASADIESGRQRLRQWSIQWYHSFLQRDAVYDPLVQEEGMRVRMQLAQMKLQQGDLEGAASAFEEVYDRDQTHPNAPLAMLRIAECNFELGHLDDAERWARRVTELHPSRPEMAAAAILLGRIMIVAERYDECVRELRSYLLPLADTPEIVDAYLLLAQAQAKRQRPDEVFRNIEVLAGSRNFRDLTEKQTIDYWFLRGLGAAGIGKWAEAMEALELFLGLAPSDSRRGRVHILLTETYTARGQLLEARSSAVAAMRHLDSLDRQGRREARIANAKTALALGQRDTAFADLEVEVRSPGADPDLILFLADSFHGVGRYQKAIATAELLAGQESAYGQMARVRKLRAMLAQAKQDRVHLEAFPKQAIAIASTIEDEALQRETAEIIGTAYSLLGDVERAADAFRGVLR
ncbi:MAG: tetratricopeptide repeat protein [Planctomycetota bacterium]